MSFLIAGALLAGAAIAAPQDPSNTNPGTNTSDAKRPAGAAGGDSLLGGLSMNAKNDPIAVTSDSLEFDYKTRLLTYKGSVVVIQADLKLEADSLQVQLAQDGNARAADKDKKNTNPTETGGQVKEVSAVGNVRLEKGTRWATAGRAVFDQEKRTVTLTENAVLHDGASLVSGERLTVYLDEERSVVDGGSGRVKAVLYPKQTGDTKREAAK